MKALTISQPFASLIANGQKFVENRTWEMFYRGPLAIHAGKGTQYLTRKELEKHPNGCIVAVALVTDCVHVSTLRETFASGGNYRGMTTSQMMRLLDHEHLEGPFGIVLADVVALDDPIPCTGAQGLWNVPVEIARQLHAAHLVGF